MVINGHYCDKCGKEMIIDDKIVFKLALLIEYWSSKKRGISLYADLCLTCAKQLKKIILETKDR